MFLNTKGIVTLILVVIVISSVAFLYVYSVKSDEEYLLSQVLSIKVPRISDIDDYIINNTLINSTYSKVIQKVEGYINVAESYNFSDQEFYNLLSTSKRGLNESKNQSNVWAGLTRAHYASVYAKTALAYVQMKLGKMNESVINSEKLNLENKLVKLKNEFDLLTYGKIDNIQELKQCIANVAFIEYRFSSVESALNASFQDVDRPESLRVAYIAGALEGANGALEEIEILMKSSSLLNDSRCRINIDSAYDRFYSMIKNDSRFSRNYNNVSLGNLTLTEARNYFNRAVRNAKNGYKAAAFMDLFISYVLLNALDEVYVLPDPWYSNVKVSAKDVFIAKRNVAQALEEIINNAKVSHLMLRMLLDYAYADVLFADSVLTRAFQSKNFSDEALRIGFALYTRAELYIKSLKNALNMLDSLLS